MKKYLNLSFMILVLLLSGCGNSNEVDLDEHTKLESDTDINAGTEIDCKNILPTRLEKIDQGGIVPTGCEAEKSTGGDYALEMLWGTWVPENQDVLEQVYNSDETILIGEDDNAFLVGCFPEKLCFGPAWAGVNSMAMDMKGRALAEDKQRTDLSNMNGIMRQIVEDDADMQVNDSLGIALESLGYGFGKAAFPIIKDNEAEIIPIDVLLNNNQRKVAYSISRDTLAVGITDAKPEDDVTETKIKEIDYSISIKGYKLTLAYKDKMVVYVPEQVFIREDNVFDICNAGLVDSYSAMDGINGITVSPQGNSIMFDTHEGYIDTSFQFNEDGIVTINTMDGDSYKYTYIYSGDALTLISSNQKSVYSLYNYILQSSNLKPTYSFYAGGNEIRLSGSDNLEWLIEKGFETNLDLKQLMASCQVTDEISLKYNDAELIVKVINPYENPIPLGQCTVCFYYFDDMSGIIEKGDGTKVGLTSFDAVDCFYAPYEKKENTLRYKGEASGIITNLDIDYSGLKQWLGEDTTGKGRRILNSNRDVEVFYDFQNGILKNYRIEVPTLLYNGLQDNVDFSVLASMEPASFSGIIEVRDTVLDRLKKEFEEADVAVHINESTGEIVLSNDILFAVDESNLSDEGKQYIDNFMAAYASVITADEFANYISEVRFEGHTDSTGSYSYNLKLSQKRADSVLNYCLNSNNGMDFEQKTKFNNLATAFGYSFSDPVYDEEGIEDREASRRVAIKFYINADYVEAEMK